MSGGDELDEIQAIFFEECAEGLTIAEEGLSAMQTGDASADIIAGVFRAVHSIKGGSGAFGHSALLGFSHRFENVLDAIRSGQITPSGEIVRIMLTAFDILSDHVAAAQGSVAAPDDSEMLALLDAIYEAKGLPDNSSADTTAASGSETEVSADEFGFTPVAATIEDLDPFGFEPVMADLVDLSCTSSNDWTVRFGPSRAAMANGGEPILVIRELEEMGARVTSVDLSRLPNLRGLDPEEGYLIWTLCVPATTDEQSIRECFDFVPPDSLIEITRAEPDIAKLEPVASVTLPEPAHAPAEAIPPVVANPRREPAPAPTPPAGEKAKTEAPAQTIRVDLAKLDSLLNLVGELVIRGSILSDRLSPADQERVELPELSRLTRQIQDNVMSLRAQPIRQAFSRVPRLLRDLTAETGKQVLLDTTGETTEVDKSVIEKIGDPLTHMIRNAVDHGIENPEDRIAAGKPAEGRVQLSAEQKGGRIIVRVADDGRGIDRVRVRAKALEREIIAPDAQLTDEEIDSLICAPGFSTAENVSAISGRGVGMDVVRSNVEALGGRLEIKSVPGQGTSFAMALPLTLAILDGMIVRLGKQRYVLPLVNVVETVQPAPNQVRATSPTSEVIEVRGTYLPVQRLAHLFGMPNNRAPEESLVIVVESEKGHVGLMVDTIDNRREVVMKSLEDNLHPIRGLGGATVLGDGSIALILDIDALVGPAGHKFSPKGMAA